MFILPRVSRLLSNRLAYNIIQDRKNRPSGNRVSQELTIPPIPINVFTKQSFQLLVRLKYSFNSLKQFDENIGNISLKQKELEVESKFGSFIFQTEPAIFTFFYTSPFTGVYKYYYDVDAKRWISNKDGHIFQENLTRETNKYFKGYLDI